MTTILDSFPRAFSVRFKELTRWDPISFERVTWHWPKAVMAPIESVLKARKEKADRSKFSFSELQPVTIHFDGSVDRRNVDGDREYKMELFFAHPGDIIVAKIDLKNGAVGIVPKDWINVVVTGHFAVYEPDRSRILPEYLHRIIQSSFFKALLWRNKVGAEGRKEVKLDFFESLEVPLPPVSVQRAVVEKWEKAQREIAEAQQRIERRKVEIDIRFFRDLGLTQPHYEEQAKCFGVWWKDFLRWSVTYNQAARAGADISQGKYPVINLGSVLELVQYGTSEKANTRGEGVPILRMNNIVDGVLDTRHLKYVRLPEKERARLLLQEGDILFNRTNSKELVGKCAVFHEDTNYVFASYLIRLRVESSKISPDFLAFAINSPIGRIQIDALSRQIIGQANINTEELRSFRIPLPPLTMQQAIVQRVAEGRTAIAQEKEKTRCLAVMVEKEIEEMILGVRPVPELVESRKLSA